MIREIDFEAAEFSMLESPAVLLNRFSMKLFNVQCETHGTHPLAVNAVAIGIVIVVVNIIAIKNSN